MKLRIVFSALLLLHGCANPAIKPDTQMLLAKPQEGKAVIVTYRKSVKPKNLSVENFIADKSLGELRNHQFNWTYVEPGDYTIKTRWQDAALIPATERNIKVEAGQYYVLQMRGGVGVDLEHAEARAKQAALNYEKTAQTAFREVADALRQRQHHA